MPQQHAAPPPLPGTTGTGDLLTEAESLVPGPPRVPRKNNGKTPRNKHKKSGMSSRSGRKGARTASAKRREVGHNGVSSSDDASGARRQEEWRKKHGLDFAGREFWSASGHLLANDTPAAHVLNSDLHEKAAYLGHITIDQVLCVDHIPSQYATASALTQFLRTQSVHVTSASVAQRKDEQGVLLANASWAVVTLLDAKAAKAALRHSEVSPFTIIGDETKSGGRNVDVKLRRYDGKPNELHDEIFTKMMANRLKLVGIKRKAAFMLLPDSDFRYLWNMLLLILLAFVAAAVPIRVAFRVELCPGSFWAVFDSFVDVFFCLDIVLEFRTVVVDEKFRIIDDWKEVAMHYFKGWFLVDVVAVVGPWLSFGANEAPETIDCADGRVDQPMKAIKVLRLVRLVHLVRLRRFAHLAAQVDGGSNLASSNKHTAGRNMKTKWEALMRRVWQMQILQILTVAHLFGCIWFGIGMMAYSDGDSRNLIPAQDNDAGWIAYAGITNETSVMERYLTSCYWAVTVLTTVGYGDIFAITVEEKIFSVCAEVFGCMVFAYLISSLSATTMEQTLVAERVSNRMAEVDEWL